jgi:hypothetical protein
MRSDSSTQIHNRPEMTRRGTTCSSAYLVRFRGRISRSDFDERRLRAQPLEDDFVRAAVEVHFACGDFAEAGDSGLVLGFHERIVALHDLSGPGGSQDDEGKPVFFAL